MVFFNYATMQMAAKIVYYGPGLCGKTTNLQHVYNKTSPQSRGEMVSLETETDRTLFFDLLPIDVGVIGGFKTRLQLYTVPGQVFYNTTRKLVLKGADGIVFVADSQEPMLDANVQSLKNLKANLDELSLSLDDIPLVIQLNKRDLPNTVSREILEARLNPDKKWPVVESSAVKGEGVFETLKLISKMTLKTLRTRMTGEQEAPSRATFHVHSGATPVSSAGAGKAAIDDELIDSKRTVSVPNPMAESSPAPELDSGGTATGLMEPGQDTPDETAEGDLDAAAESFEGGELPPPAQFPYPRDPEAMPEPEEQPPTSEAEELEESAEEDRQEDRPGQAEPQAASGNESAETPVKRVKVRSTVDIMAELEVLRRNATGKAKGDDETQPARRELHKSLNVRLDQAHRDALRSVTITVELNDGDEKSLQRETQTWELTPEELRKLIVNLSVDLD